MKKFNEGIKWKFQDPCRAYLFKISPSARSVGDGPDENLLSSFVRSVTMDRNEVVVKFMLDEGGKLWQFFSYRPFVVTVLTRTGNPSAAVIVKGELKARYIESLAHDNLEMAIGVVIIENKI